MVVLVSEVLPDVGRGFLVVNGVARADPQRRVAAYKDCGSVIWFDGVDVEFVSRHAASHFK